VPKEIPTIPSVIQLLDSGRNGRFFKITMAPIVLSTTANSSVPKDVTAVVTDFNFDLLDRKLD
jgi:hypothetical protein